MTSFELAIRLALTLLGLITPPVWLFTGDGPGGTPDFVSTICFPSLVCGGTGQDIFAGPLGNIIWASAMVTFPTDLLSVFTIWVTTCDEGTKATLLPLLKTKEPPLAAVSLGTPGIVTLVIGFWIGVSDIPDGRFIPVPKPVLFIDEVVSSVWYPVDIGSAVTVGDAGSSKLAELCGFTDWFPVCAADNTDSFPESNSDLLFPVPLQLRGTWKLICGCGELTDGWSITGWADDCNFWGVWISPADDTLVIWLPGFCSTLTWPFLWTAIVGTAVRICGVVKAIPWGSPVFPRGWTALTVLFAICKVILPSSVQACCTGSWK